jgi:hypothetical protein
MNQIPFRKEQLPLPSGNLFTRMLTAKVIAAARKSRPEDVAMELWPNDRVLAEAYAIKATSAPAMTSVAGWAQELAVKRVADMVTALGGASTAVQIMSSGLLMDWDGYGSISVPAFVASANNASFVQEGNPIPVRQLSTTASVLLPYKVAVIAALTREMMEGSNAERLISDVLVRSAALAIDSVFFGTAASSSAQPAGIRYNISTLTASSSTDPFGAVFEDVGTLISSIAAVGGNGPYYLVGPPGKIMSMKGRYDLDTKGEAAGDGGTIIEMMSSQVSNDLIAIAAPAIAAAVSSNPDVEVVDAAVLVMDTSPGAAGTTGTGEKSMWQTDSLAIKVRWPVSWILRNTAGVAWLTPGWK